MKKWSSKIKTLSFLRMTSISAAIKSIGQLHHIFLYYDGYFTDFIYRYSLIKSVPVGYFG